MTKQIKSLLHQAETFRTQGLLQEAQNKYELVAELIRNNSKLKNRQKLLTAITKKLSSLKKNFEFVGNAPTTPEMSTQVNELIKKLFSFSEKDIESKEESALEGAIALAKFGQFEGALAEFNKLITVNTVRVAAAKNILRCHLTLNSADAAFAKFSEWEAGDLFSSDQIDKIRLFFEELLDKKGIRKEAIKEETDIDVEEAQEADDFLDISSQDEEDEDFLDISAVAITFDNGQYKGEQVELDVSFQSGNIISLIISGDDQGLIDNFKVGNLLEDVHFYSPIAIFRGSGIISAKTQITSGPKKGDYSLDIKIESL